MKFEWQKPTIDAAIVVAGAALLDKYVISNVSFLADLLNKLPADLMGISVKTFVLGAVTLIVAKHFMK